MEHKSKQIFISIIAVVILVLLAVFLFQGMNKSDDGQLTEAQRRAILESLSNDSESTPLSDEERSAILESLSNDSESAPLSEEERQAILNSLAS